MPSRRWWRRICSTCATAASWIAASTFGKTFSISSPRNSFPRCSSRFYLDQQYIPSRIHVPVDFEDREVLEELLSEKRGRKVEIQTPQRGQKKALLGAGGDQCEARFRPALPRDEAIGESDAGSRCRTC